MIKTFVSLQLVLLLGVLSNAWLILDLELNPKDRIREYYGRALFRFADEPLFLTPLLEHGKVEEAQRTSLVPSFVDDVRSHSGFLTVDKKYNSNMFFWYVVAEESPETAPVVLWLQGGPGGSSLYGLFVEHGPYTIGEDGKVHKRDVRWSKSMHVLYVDNPVGTGYSFTDSEEGYSKDEVSIGKNLYSVLQQFFTMFPNLRDNDFYITGESYAGKYIPALGYTIHMNNKVHLNILDGEHKINLKGLAMGNGLSDPINQWDYGSYLNGIGLIDERQRELFEEQQNLTFNSIKKNDLLDAFISYNKILGKFGSLFKNLTGYEYVYNYLISYNVPFDSRFVSFLEQASTRKAIHVGSLGYQMISKEVYLGLIQDFSQSVAPWVAELANHYKLMMYNGELDIVVGYPLTANYVSKLDWCGADELATAERKQWRVDGQLAGYIKTSAPDSCDGSIRLVMVRNAGHTVPEDQPLWTYNLISDFIKERK